jgi:hypothetical protein
MTTIPTLSPIFSSPNLFALTFREFLSEFNVVGLGIGALVAQNTMEIGKSLVDSLVMPIVTGIVTGTTPTFTYYSLIQSVLTFLVAMFVIFLLMNLFGIKVTKPVSYVRIVEPNIKGSLGKYEGFMNDENNDGYENKNM